MMEEGEIHDTRTAAEAYDPSYEWPGESSTSGIASSTASASADLSSRDSPYNSSTKTPCLRLIAITSSILPPKRKLVLLPDGYEQLQFGRDVGPEDTPRIRLKEMEVSKLHATVYWDADRFEWGIVDMGSMHGTFIDPSPSSSSGASSMVNGDDSTDAGHRGPQPRARIRIRLSSSRVASVPRRLRHLDLLTIGSTTFSIHIHDDQLPCQECSPSGGDEIPLFSQKKGTASAPLKRSRDAESDAYPRASLNPKKSLTALKRQLLTRHDDQLTGDSNAALYLDRSARRRALNPGSHLDSPGVLVPSTTPVSSTPPIAIAQSPPVPGPLPHTNIGHRLLMKQGWQPGTSLGSPADYSTTGEGRVGLVEPLEVSSSSHRAGLGSRVTGTASGLNWKDREKQKRWDRVR